MPKTWILDSCTIQGDLALALVLEMGNRQCLGAFLFRKGKAGGIIIERLEEYCVRHGTPGSLIFDQSPQFCSKRLMNWALTNGIRA